MRLGSKINGYEVFVFNSKGIVLPLRIVLLYRKLRGEMVFWRQNGGHQKGHQFGFN